MEQFSQALRQRILDWLAAQVPASRLNHILRVEEMASDLAQRHGVSAVRAAQAGLMHDLAKNFKPTRLLAIAQAENLALDPILESNPHLLHADVSAIVARDEFQVTDADILAAIANHTLGKPGMDALSCIVFLADSLEPGRGNTPTLEMLRETSWQDLPKAVWMTCDYTLSQLMAAQRLIHPRALATRNWFLQSAKTGHASQSRPVKYSHTVHSLKFT
ncbi:MAG: bis(5'-nucleosyl)-tetraphosphatase (symmetrical) YqeK [Synechococcales bacterium]|nr:bis(5'-nucleosyl)-tetraphosphatase (symmetrical) YqeK [Synechococcales bacterium]